MKRRLAFIINSLAGGGAERVFCTVIDGLRAHIADAYDVDVILLDDEPQAYTPPPFAHTLTLGAHGKMAASVTRLVRTLAARKPVAALSFLSRANCANVIAARALGYRALISERVATTAHFGDGARAGAQRWVTRALYPRAHRILAVSEGVKRSLVRDFALQPDRIDAIPNPVDAHALRALAKEEPAAPLPDRFMVSAGRLTANKNFPTLLEAYARSDVAQDLVILGDGEDRGALETHARALGVYERVHFLGFQRNPFAIFARADFFVSTSNAEGFPNALVESMAVGLPAAFTNCPSGPAEILAGDPDRTVNGAERVDYGILCAVNDADAIAQAMRMLAAPETNAHYRIKSLQRVDAYAPQAIYDAYWRVLSQAMN